MKQRCGNRKYHLENVSEKDDILYDINAKRKSPRAKQTEHLLVGLPFQNVA
jgi:hypothetical protein